MLAGLAMLGWVIPNRPATVSYPPPTPLNVVENIEGSYGVELPSYLTLESSSSPTDNAAAKFAFLDLFILLFEHSNIFFICSVHAWRNIWLQIRR